jgi:chemosensory pili system protein ChpA (sensor histidine kinase/response regulator)
MSDIEALARSALGWLRPEIDKALSAARAALEDYSESGADASRLAEVRKRIAEVRGSLQMAQLHGAAVLAEEMEQVTRAIEAGKLDDAPAAIEALMRALLQLPDYLERVQQGLSDTANLLLPLINALRAARAARTMGEKTAFFPGFAGVRPSAMTAAVDVEPLPVLAKRLRHRYHLALLGWLRKQRPEQALAQLLSVLDRLQQSARSEPVVQMLWAAGGLVEALTDGGLDASVPAHSLLGQVDRQVKRVLDAGDERILEQEPPQELIRLLLYYVAVSSSHGARVQALNSAFHLGEQLPRGEARAAAEEALSRPNEAAFGAVTAALKEQLDGIKDGLDLFIRTADRGRLDSLSASLRSVGGTFAILGREDLQQQAAEHAARIQAVAAGADATAAEDIKAAAAWLLEAENPLSGQEPAPQTLEHGGAEPEAVESGGVQLSSSSMFEVKRSLLKEAMASLALVKDAYTAYLAQPAEGAGRLAAPAEQLRQVAGALTMMEEPRAAELTTAFSRYVQSALLQDGMLPDAAAQEAAAEAMASIEFYLEAVAEQRPGRDHVLDVADSALDVLGYAPEQEGGTEAVEDVAAGTMGAVDASSPPEADLVEDLSSDLQSLAQDLEPAPAPLDEAEAEVEEVEVAPPPESVEELQARLADEASPEWPAAAPQIEVEDAAGVEEIALMPPVESAEEMESRLEAERAEWTAAELPAIEVEETEAEEVEDISPDSLQALSFGVAEVAEAAAADEVQASTPVEDLPAAWLALIPENGRMALAAPFSEGLDPEIFGIFIEEAAEVLAVINEHFPRWSANLDDRESLTTFRRAFHTLKGSGRMAGAMLVGEFSWSVENLLNRVIDRTVPPGEGLLQLMREAIAMLPALLGQMSGGPAPGSAQVAYLMAQAHALASGQLPPDPSPGTTAIPVAHAETAVHAASTVDTGAQDAALDTTGSFTGIHPALKKIYLQEAGVYLEQINTWLYSPEAASEPVPFEISRAVHTLSGSSATVGVDAVAAVCHPLDQLLRLLHSQAVPADGMVRNLISRVCEATALALERLGQDGDPAAADTALVAAIQSCLQIEEAVSGKHVALFHQDQPEAPGTGRAVPEGDASAGQGPEGLPTQPGMFSSPDAEEFFNSTEITASPDQLPESAESSPEPPPWEAASSSHLEEEASDTAPDEGAAAFSGLTGLMAEIGSVASPAASPPPPSGMDSALQTAVHSAVFDSAEAGEGEAMDPELLGIFMEESAEIMEHSAETLRRWETERLEGRWMVAFQRDLHTLKGGARMVGVWPVADLSHSVEDIMTAVVDGHTPVSDRLFDLLHLAHDQLHDMIEAMRLRRELKPAPGLIAEIEALRNASIVEHTGAPPSEPPVNISDSQRSPAWQTDHQPPPSIAVQALESSGASALLETGAHAAGSGGFEAVEAAPPEPAATAEDRAIPAAAVEPVTDVVERRTGARVEPDTMRVRADLVDGLVNLAGEVNIFRARMEQHSGRFKFGLTEFDQTIARLRAQLRRLEMETEAQVQYRFEQQARDERSFDPLEMDRYTQLQQMSRSLMESVGDLVSLQDMLVDMNRDTETLLRQQGRVNTEMQERLLRARMVPFHTLAARLRRVVRQTAAELGRQAELRLNGAAEELDRNVLERMTAPLEHMLRNAVAHGLEAPAARLAAGKPEVGTVTINVMREGAEVVLTVADDGSGLDVGAIRSKAVQKGLMDASADLPDTDIMRFVLEAGFSTADAVTQIAGRGVGMDVVNSEIRQLGGVLDIDSVAGRGAAFTVRLPFTLAITQALLVGLADELYAIPLASITGVTRLPAAQLEARYQKDERDYLYGGENFRIHNLKEWVGLGGVRAAHEQQPALVMVRAGGHRVAFHVDALFGRREVVVKSFGPQLAGISGLSGGTVLGDGRVALIFDMPALVRMVAGMQATTLRHHELPEAVAEPGKVTVMVVDDSLTVRRVTSRLLERNGMTVITAKDGVEAVGKLEEVVPDIMLLDVEMPRMDGFELAAHVRNNPRVRHVPIMMITSRTGEKHRQHAASIGVNRYLGKPYQENDLLHNIRELLAEAGVAMPVAGALPALAAAVAAATVH